MKLFSKRDRTDITDNKKSTGAVDLKADYAKAKDEARDFVSTMCGGRNDCIGCMYTIRNRDFIFCVCQISQEQYIRDGIFASPQVWEK